MSETFENFISDDSSDNYSPISLESLIRFSFEPSIKEIPSNLMEVKNFLCESGGKSGRKICIETSTPLVLILIPLLLPLRDRVQVKITLEDYKKVPLAGSELSIKNEIRHTRKFRELLEAAQSLKAHGIKVLFSKKVV